MKKKSLTLYIIAALIVFFGAWASCKEDPGISSAAKKSDEKSSEVNGTKKILVVYFSQTGNTREIATQIHQFAEGDIFEIKSVKTYPDDYEELKKVAKQELNSEYKPALKTKISNIRSYNIIFIGYPIWWGTFPAPVRTFLSENDLKGKTIVPFCTHLGSGLGISVKDIKKLCPESTILDGLAVWGNDTKNAQNKITKWLQKLEIIK